MPQGSIFAAIARKFSGAVGPVQLDQQLALWSSQRHGKYYAAAYGTPAIASPATAARAGSLFRCASQTPATLSAALSATYTGLCLSNPAGSAVNLAVKRVGVAIMAAPAGMLALGLIGGWLAAGVTGHTTPLDSSIVNAYLGATTAAPPIVGPASQAHVDAAATLVGTPTWIAWFSSNVATTNNAWAVEDLDDSLIIPPGGYVAIGGSAGVTTGFLGSFLWEELSA